jgi:hypothetical protein
VKTLQESSDSVCPEMVILVQVQNLADNCRRHGSREVVRRSRPIGQACLTMLVVALFPAVEHCTRDPELTASLRYMPMLASGVLEDSQLPGDNPCLFCLCHLALLSPKH